MSVTQDQILARVKESMRVGEYLHAYDWALLGLEDYLEDEELRYYAVLALARTGATDQARSRYTEFKLDTVSNVNAAALAARLVKDKALISHPSKKPAHFIEAAKLYEDLFNKSENKDYYPAINAATTYFLAGEHERAHILANQVLDLCAATSPSYWRYASEAEAHLLNNDIEPAKQALSMASDYANDNFAEIGATKKQLALIHNDSDVLNTLKIPQVMHYAGHIISPNDTEGRFPANREAEITEKISSIIDELEIGIAYGSLASGADIIFAEEVLKRGGEVHITLPFDLEEFKKISVVNSGQQWVERFDYCWENASSQSFTSTGAYQDDDTLFDYCSLYSMGRACLRQQHLAAPLSQVLVWDEKVSSAVAGTYKDHKTWTELGFKSHIISLAKPEEQSEQANRKVYPKPKNEKRLHAIVFGDIKGFSSLPDAKLPIFVNEIMGCLADVLDSMGDDVLMANTWGDGLFIVLKDVEVAARCSIKMQKALKKLELDDDELKEKAELRLGIHFGPVYTIKDPVTKRENFFGEHVNRAARIEPITPPRQVYVTESFAAQLALTQGAHYKTEYVGYMPMAKDYGDLPMYLLREKFDD